MSVSNDYFPENATKNENCYASSTSGHMMALDGPILAIDSDLAATKSSMSLEWRDYQNVDDSN